MKWIDEEEKLTLRSPDWGKRSRKGGRGTDPVAMLHRPKPPVPCMKIP